VPQLGGRDGRGSASVAVRTFSERPVVFVCHGLELLGIAAVPNHGRHRTGLVVIVGGPQYRAGSHRQFTLLCRELAAHGIASFRFDYHGSGDSDGPPALGVGGIEDDLRAAIDAFVAQAPGVGSVVLWGLCGAASASALYAPEDPRVRGLVMLNPWVRTESGLARVQLRHYYLSRAFDPAFWRKLLKGEVALVTSGRALVRSVLAAVGAGKNAGDGDPATQGNAECGPAIADDRPLPVRILDNLQRAAVPTMVILSGGDDLTANEYRQLCNESAAWRDWSRSANVECHEIEDSNHTFARAEWRNRVAALTAHWVRRC
jgi:uncharacterized protein